MTNAEKKITEIAENSVKDNSKKVELIALIMNEKNISDKDKIYYIQSMLLGWTDEETFRKMVNCLK